MKVNRLETHDRLQHLKEDQAINIAKGAEDCMKKNELSLALQEKSPYIYLFAHPRTADDGVTKVMYWQPRLTKPEAQENSYLFRAISKTDMIEVCWLLPPREMKDQYKKGNITEHELVEWSYMMLRSNKNVLESAHPDDLPDHVSRNIYQQVIGEKRQDIRLKKMITPELMVSSESSSLPILSFP